MVNPFRWLTLSEDVDALHVTAVYPVQRLFFANRCLPRYKDTSSAEVKSALQFPEVRRLFFHSYSVIAERIGSDLILSDPLRENGYLYYPPHFKRVVVTLED